MKESTEADWVIADAILADTMHLEVKPEIKIYDPLIAYTNYHYRWSCRHQIIWTVGDYPGNCAHGCQLSYDLATAQYRLTPYTHSPDNRLLFPELLQDPA